MAVMILILEKTADGKISARGALITYIKDFRGMQEDVNHVIKN